MRREEFEGFLMLLPELDLLTQIAQHLNTELRLRGSLVRNVVNTAIEAQHAPPRKEDARPASLFDFVPAFSDIDLVAPSGRVASEARALIGAHLPYSRFFHWDMRTPADIKRYRGLAYIALYGQPEIAFGRSPPEGASEIFPEPAAIRCVASEKTADVVAFHVHVDKSLWTSPPPRPTITWNTERARFPVTAEALIDLFYLARQYPDLLGTPPGRRLRTLARAERILKDITSGSPIYDRLVFAMLKFLYSNQRSKVLAWFRELCGNAASRTTDSTLRSLLALCAEPDKYEPAVAIIRPENEGGRWVRRLHRLQPLGTREEWLKESDAFAHWIREAKEVTASGAATPQPGTQADPNLELEIEMMRVRLTPIAEVKVESPPDPCCCRHEDFARGAVELAWQDQEGPAWPVSSELAIVDLTADEAVDSAMGPGEDDLALAHAYTVFGKVGTMRTDYNFLSVLAGRSRWVKIVGAGKAE